MRPPSLVCRCASRMITVLLEGQPAVNADCGVSPLMDGCIVAVESVRWDTVDRWIVTCCLKYPQYYMQSDLECVCVCACACVRACVRVSTDVSWAMILLTLCGQQHHYMVQFL